MKYIIIGASAAGMQAAEEIRKIDRGADIKVFSKESYYPYSRCLISRYVDGRLKENNFFFKTDHFFEDLNIEVFLGI
ncbi:MAG: NAD(P)/FAD-dependent oxidoreductase, partial [Actinobacteria bacterium]|nr:NAD(P)/FAD-dependent oxidoreductase [Actinomycetota bacterium]